ncbi:MAG: serine--tRNA ligase, partial [Ignavibacteria bacterium]|nr:serine--tRNA ligase [Ignavibacteria bacterium]
MLDIKFIRENPDRVREGVRKKGESVETVANALRADEARREILQKAELLKSRKNTVSAQVARMKAQGQDAGPIIAEMKSVSDEIKALDDRLRDAEEQLRALLLQIPNLPHTSVPEGRTPQENREIATWGEVEEMDFPLKSHWDLIEHLGIIDFARGTKITGAGFPVYVGKGAMLERALINFFLDEAAAKGYTEMIPPLIVNGASATGTGQLPD